MEVNPVVKLVGKHQSNYIDKEGKLRKYKTLYVTYPYTEETPEGEFDTEAAGDYQEGIEAGVLRCPRTTNFDKLRVGAYYTLIYELQNYGGKLSANLVGLSLLEEVGAGKGGELPFDG